MRAREEMSGTTDPARKRPEKLDVASSSTPEAGGSCVRVDLGIPKKSDRETRENMKPGESITERGWGLEEGEDESDGTSPEGVYRMRRDGVCASCGYNPDRCHDKKHGHSGSFRPTPATLNKLPQLRRVDLHFFDVPKGSGVDTLGVLTLVFFNIMFPTAAVDLLVRQVRQFKKSFLNAMRDIIVQGKTNKSYSSDSIRLMSSDSLSTAFCSFLTPLCADKCLRYFLQATRGSRAEN